jgi:hypothetical protein
MLIKVIPLIQFLKEGKMNNHRIKIKWVGFIVFMMGVIGAATTFPVMGQEGKNQKISPSPETGVLNDYSKSVDWGIKSRKQPGVPLGSQRSEIIRIFSEKNISPQQRTVPMDIFPRLIGEISFIKKANLFYTQDRLSKLNMIFDVPIDSKTLTGEPLFDFYGELRKNLIRTYGQPTNTTSYVHPNFPYRLIALETGNAYFFDYWENVDDLKILLSLKGREGEVEFTLTYQYLPLFEGT